MLVPSEAGERPLTVFYAPVSRQAADRIAGREEMSTVTGDELRARTGHLERAKERRAVGRVKATDEKLVASVTAPRTWPTSEIGRRLVASLRLAGYVPQRLDGAQDAAFTAAAIPLGVGLPNRRTAT